MMTPINEKKLQHKYNIKQTTKTYEIKIEENDIEIIIKHTLKHKVDKEFDISVIS